MRYEEISATDATLLEIAVTRSYARNAVRSKALGIAQHLIKLLGCSADDGLRSHWKAEIKAWTGELSIYVLKPNNKRIAQAAMFEWLYGEPFVGAEISAVRTLLNGMVRKQGYVRNALSDNEVSDRLRDGLSKLSFALTLPKADEADNIIDSI